MHFNRRVEGKCSSSPRHHREATAGQLGVTFACRYSRMIMSLFIMCKGKSTYIIQCSSTEAIAQTFSSFQHRCTSIYKKLYKTLQKTHNKQTNHIYICTILLGSKSPTMNFSYESATSSYNPLPRAAGKIQYKAESKPRPSNCMLPEARGSGLKLFCTPLPRQQDKPCVKILFSVKKYKENSEARRKRLKLKNTAIKYRYSSSATATVSPSKRFGNASAKDPSYLSQKQNPKNIDQNTKWAVKTFAAWREYHKWTL